MLSSYYYYFIKTRLIRMPRYVSRRPCTHTSTYE